MPTFLVREFVDLLLPFLTTLVNTSLMQGQLPGSQKHAIVTPRLKRSGLDPSDIANFRPVSNLTFMSKVVERAATSQLNAYLSAKCERSAASSSVGVQTEAFDRNCDASRLV